MSRDITFNNFENRLGYFLVNSKTVQQSNAL